MYDSTHIYGFDVQTDARPGQDPATARILWVAIGTPLNPYCLVADDDEGDLLRHLADELDALPEGLLVTWDGSVSDFPLLGARMKADGMDGWSWGPELTEQPRLAGYAPPGYGHAYAAQWLTSHGGRHMHLDISYAYRAYALENGVAPTFPAVAAALGLGPREIQDWEPQLHLVSTELEARVGVCETASAIRSLALRLLGLLWQ